MAESKFDKDGFLFERAYRIAEGIAVAAKDGKCGYMKTSGEFITPFRYDLCFPFNKGLAIAQDGDVFVVIDSAGKTVFEHPNITGHFFYEDRLEVKDEDGNSGFVDKTGKLVIPCGWDSVNDFCCGRAAVGKDGNWGFIDRDGTVIVEPQYGVWDFSEGIGAIDDGKKTYFIDTNGEKLFKAAFDTFRGFNEGFAGIAKDDKWAVIDKTGKFLSDYEYDDFRHFINGFARVKRGERYGFIDTSGKAVIPFEYEFLMPCFMQGLCAAKKDGAYGFINPQGEMVIPPQFYSAYNFPDTEGDESAASPGSDLTLVCRKGKNGKEHNWGFINIKGELVISYSFDDAEPFECGIAPVQSGAKWGFITPSGKLLHSADYAFLTLAPSERKITDDDIHELFHALTEKADVPAFTAALKTLSAGIIIPDAFKSLFINVNNILVNKKIKKNRVDVFPLIEAFVALLEKHTPSVVDLDCIHHILENLGGHIELYPKIKPWIDLPFKYDSNALSHYYVSREIAALGLYDEALLQLRRVAEVGGLGGPDGFPEEMKEGIENIIKEFAKPEETHDEENDSERTVNYLEEWQRVVDAANGPGSLAEALVDHFSYLVDTSRALEILEDIMKKAVGVEISAGEADNGTDKLLVHFPGLVFECSPPLGDPPSSYEETFRLCLKKHKSIHCESLMLDLAECCAEDIGLSMREAGLPKDLVCPLWDYSDCWIYHPERKTSYGKSLLCLLSHESGKIENTQDTSIGALFLTRWAESLDNGGE
jgi:hypothetical protein